MNRISPRPVPIKGPAITTIGGPLFPILHPVAAAVDFADFAESLAKTNLFTGRTPGITYSAAQHAVLVAELLDFDARPYGLLHRAHLSPIGGVPDETLEALAALGGKPAMDELVARLDAAIHTAAGLDWPSPQHIRAAVETANSRVYATEIRDLAAEPLDADEDLPPPLPRIIRPWPWPKAADEWLARLERWLPITPQRKA